MALSIDSFENLWRAGANEMAHLRECIGYLSGIIAAYYGIKVSLSLLRGIWTHVVARLYWRFRDVRREYGGSWAVVTGPTRGIGKAYALQLAEKGFNIALVGRDSARLIPLRDEIKSKYGVESQCVDIDFLADVPSAIVTKLAPIADLPVAVLVNNVGWRNTVGAIHIWETQAVEQMWPACVINCYGLAAVTRVFLPGMLARKKGAIINVASLAGIKPLVFNATYAASKAFVDSFSRGLEMELNIAKYSGITIQTLCPGFVYTGEHFHYKKPSILTPSEHDYVRAALPTLGFNSRTGGYFYHDLQFYLFDKFGDWGHRFVTTWMQTSRRAAQLKQN